MHMPKIYMENITIPFTTLENIETKVINQKFLIK